MVSRNAPILNSPFISLPNYVELISMYDPQRGSIDHTAPHRLEQNHLIHIQTIPSSEKMSHPGSRKQNRSLHTCAQDVQITRMTNNMVNIYNISLNYKLESLQNDPWVQKKYYRVARKSKRRCVFHRHN
jgi:hypothetical protein